MATKLLIMLLALALTASSATLAAKQASEKLQVRVRGRGTSLVLTGRGGVRRTLDMKEKVDAAKLEDVTLLFANRKESFNYLVVDACGSSKLVPDARHCGAGTECNLLWLKLDSAWRLKDAKSVRYESCWIPISSSDSYKISGNALRMEYEDFSEKKKNYKLSYDAARPDAGFVIEQSEIIESKPN